LLVLQGAAGDVYNVSSGQAVSVAEIVKHLRSFSSRPFQVEVEQRRARPGEVARLCGSNRKLRRATGWKPEYTLAKTLRDTYEFWKSATAAPHHGPGCALATRQQ
jgi:UDP-glucose 4-epimerase